MTEHRFPYEKGDPSRRRLSAISLGVAIALVLPLVASGNASAAGSKHISMWFFSDPKQDPFLHSGINAWEKQNPGYHVAFDDTAPPTGTGGLEDKLTTAIATGTLPDVIPVISTDAAVFEKAHDLLPVTNADAKLLGYSSLAAMSSTFAPGSLEAYEKAGVLYAVPWQSSTFDLACNTVPFREAGINLTPYTTKSMTWSQFIKLGEKVIKANPGHYYKNTSGQWNHNFFKLPVFFDDTWAMQTVTMFEAQAGGSVLPNAHGGGLTSPQSLVAFNEMKAISDSLGDPHIGPSNPTDLHIAFADGQMTCDLAGNFLQALFLEPSSPVLKHFVILKMPTIYPGKVGNVIWEWAFGVNSKTPSSLVHPIFSMLKSTIDRPAQEVFEGGIWGPQIRNWAALPGMNKYVDVKTIDANTAGAQPIFETPAYPTIAHYLRGELEAIILGGAPVKSTLQSAASQVVSMLKAG